MSWKRVFLFGKPTLIALWVIWAGGVLTLVPALVSWAVIFWTAGFIFLTISTVRSLE